MPIKRKTWTTEARVSEYAKSVAAVEKLTGWRLVKERNQTGRFNLVANTPDDRHIDLALGVSADTVSEIVYAIEAAAEAAVALSGCACPTCAP